MKPGERGPLRPSMTLRREKERREKVRQRGDSRSLCPPWPNAIADVGEGDSWWPQASSFERFKQRRPGKDVYPQLSQSMMDVIGAMKQESTPSEVIMNHSRALLWQSW